MSKSMTKFGCVINVYCILLGFCEFEQDFVFNKYIIFIVQYEMLSLKIRHMNLFYFSVSFVFTRLFMYDINSF